MSTADDVPDSGGSAEGTSPDSLPTSSLPAPSSDASGAAPAKADPKARRKKSSGKKLKLRKKKHHKKRLAKLEASLKASTRVLADLTQEVDGLQRALQRRSGARLVRKSEASVSAASAAPVPAEKVPAPPVGEASSVRKDKTVNPGETRIKLRLKGGEVVVISRELLKRHGIELRDSVRVKGPDPGPAEADADDIATYDIPTADADAFRKAIHPFFRAYVPPEKSNISRTGKSSSTSRPVRPAAPAKKPIARAPIAPVDDGKKTRTIYPSRKQQQAAAQRNVSRYSTRGRKGKGSRKAKGTGTGTRIPAPAQVRAVRFHRMTPGDRRRTLSECRTWGLESLRDSLLIQQYVLRLLRHVEKRCDTDCEGTEKESEQQDCQEDGLEDGLEDEDAESGVLDAICLVRKKRQLEDVRKNLEKKRAFLASLKKALSLSSSDAAPEVEEEGEVAVSVSVSLVSAVDDADAKLVCVGGKEFRLTSKMLRKCIPRKSVLSSCSNGAFFDRDARLFAQVYRKYLQRIPLSPDVLSGPDVSLLEKDIEVEAGFFGLSCVDDIAREFATEFPTSLMGASNVAIKKEEDAARFLFANEPKSPILDDPHLCLIPVFDNISTFETVRAERPEESSRFFFEYSKEKLPRFRNAPFRIVRSFERFKSNFNNFTGGLLDGLDYDNIFVAGGAVLASLLDVDTPISSLSDGQSVEYVREDPEAIRMACSQFLADERLPTDIEGVSEVTATRFHANILRLPVSATVLACLLGCRARLCSPSRFYVRDMCCVVGKRVETSVPASVQYLLKTEFVVNDFEAWGVRSLSFFSLPDLEESGMLPMRLADWRLSRDEPHPIEAMKGYLPIAANEGLGSILCVVLPGAYKDSGLASAGVDDELVAKNFPVVLLSFFSDRMESLGPYGLSEFLQCLKIRKQPRFAWGVSSGPRRYGYGRFPQAPPAPKKKNPYAHYARSDIDLFLCGLTTDAEGVAKTKHVYETIVKNIEARKGQLKKVEGDDHWNDVLCFRTKYSVTFRLPSRLRPIQVILRLYKSPAEVLIGFDVDSCGVGFDGKCVFATKRAQRAISMSYNLVDNDRQSTTYVRRLTKYAKRGFRVSVPGYDPKLVRRDGLLAPHAVTDREFDIAPSVRLNSVFGLGQLILLERQFQLAPRRGRSYGRGRGRGRGGHQHHGKTEHRTRAWMEEKDYEAEVMTLSGAFNPFGAPQQSKKRLDGLLEKRMQFKRVCTTGRADTKKVMWLKKFFIDLQIGRWGVVPDFERRVGEAFEVLLRTVRGDRLAYGKKYKVGYPPPLSNFSSADRVQAIQAEFVAVMVDVKERTGSGSLGDAMAKLVAADKKLLPECSMPIVYGLNDIDAVLDCTGRPEGLSTNLPQKLTFVKRDAGSQQPVVSTGRDGKLMTGSFQPLSLNFLEDAYLTHAEIVEKRTSEGRSIWIWMFKAGLRDDFPWARFKKHHSDALNEAIEAGLPECTVEVAQRVVLAVDFRKMKVTTEPEYVPRGAKVRRVKGFVYYWDK